MTLSTLTPGGLYGGGTYYFRVGTLNWNGMPNYAPAVSTRMPVLLASVTDLIGTPSTEGLMTLQWTAPASNLQANGAAAGYAIRVATFSIVAYGASTTTWWAAATDVRTLVAPSAPASPPVPGSPGTLQSLLLTGLEPSVTYYAALVSSDTTGGYSDIDVRAPGAAQAKALIFDAVPSSPTAPSVIALSSTSLQISWTATTSYDRWTYTVYVDSTVPNDFGDAYSISVASTTTSLTLIGLSTGPYSLRVTAVDKGAHDRGA